MNNNINVLIVDDSPEILELFEQLIMKIFGFNKIDTAASEKLAKDKIKNKKYHLIICDLVLSDGEWDLKDYGGIRVFEFARNMNPEINFILAAGYPNLVKEVPGLDKKYIIDKNHINCLKSLIAEVTGIKPKYTN
jgi:response regulator of citrate/malate metabolism